jgi:hypothetical protein
MEQQFHEKIMVSCFSNFKKPYPKKSVDLFEWFFDPKIRKNVEWLGKETKDNKELYNEYKMYMPCITPSGTFSIRNEKSLIKHSGYICLDIDGKENPHITDFNWLRDEISKISNVALCSLSLSEKGVFCLIPIKYAEKHREHFNSLAKDFEAMGIIIDKKCINVSRLRAASSDVNIYVNKNATVYERYIESKKKSINQHPKNSQKASNTSKTDHSAEKTLKQVKKIVSKIEADSIDITADYSSWFSIGCALANEFGDDGRDFFHIVSQYNAQYDEEKTNIQFDNCLKGSYNYTIGTFFLYARENNLL